MDAMIFLLKQKDCSASCFLALSVPQHHYPITHLFFILPHHAFVSLLDPFFFILVSTASELFDLICFCLFFDMLHIGCRLQNRLGC